MAVIAKSGNAPLHWTYRILKECFFEKSYSKETNSVLKKYNITKLEIIESDSIYAQFKTRVHGHTLLHYIFNDALLSPTRFDLRKSFVHFLKSINKAPPLGFHDVHASNMMYDEQKQRWEIIDGTVKEIPDVFSDRPNSDRLLRNLLFFFNIEANALIDALGEAALEKDSEYNEMVDSKIMEDLKKQIKEDDVAQELVFESTPANTD